MARLAVKRGQRRAAFFAHQHDIATAQKMRHPDLFRALVHGEQGSLVHQVRQVGTGKAHRLPRQFLEINTIGQLDLAAMDMQDVGALFQVRQA